MIVIIEEAASDKLLNASAKIETELESNPTDNLIKKSNEYQNGEIWKSKTLQPYTNNVISIAQRKESTLKLFSFNLIV